METVPLVAQMGIARLPNARFAPEAVGRERHADNV
jgi:hypothetical protein